MKQLTDRDWRDMSDKLITMVDGIISEQSCITSVLAGILIDLVTHVSLPQKIEIVDGAINYIPILAANEVLDRSVKADLTRAYEACIASQTRKVN